MQDAIRRLVDLGPLPSEATEDVAFLQLWQRTLETVAPPIDNEEAKALCTLFGVDECFGAAWTLVHLIETSPTLPDDIRAPAGAEYWVEMLRDRDFRAKQKKG